MSAGLSISPSISPEEFYEKKNALMRGKFFCLFRTLSEKHSDVRKTFLAVDLNYILYIPRENFFSEYFLEVRWPFLLFLFFFQKKYFVGFSETVFYERWGSSWKKTFFPKKNVYSETFWSLSKFFLDFWEQFAQG